MFSMPYLLHVSAVRKYLIRPSCLVNLNIKKIKITDLFINSGLVPPSCAPLHASHLLRSTSGKSSGFVRAIKRQVCPLPSAAIYRPTAFQGNPRTSRKSGQSKGRRLHYIGNELTEVGSDQRSSTIQYDSKSKHSKRRQTVN